MTPTLMDHVLVALLAVVVPVSGALHFRRMKARLAAGEEDVRIRQYRLTISLQILTAAVATAVWVSSRPVEGLATLDLGGPGWIAAAGWAALATGCMLLIGQVVALRRNPEGLAAVRTQLEPVEVFLPHTRRELRLFYGLSLTAGTCEEMVYRGFLMAYFLALAGPVLAIVGSTLLFGLAHAYQGPGGMVRTGAVGLVLAAVYAATGSLLAPMILHTVLDMTSGTLGYRALRTAAGPAPPAPAHR